MKLLFQLATYCTWAAVTGTMFWVGLTKIRNASESEPTVYESLAEINSDGPKWVEVKNCAYDLTECVEETTGATGPGAIVKLFIPLRTLDGNRQVKYTLETNDPFFLEPYKKMLQLEIDINSKAVNLEFAKEDPEYLKFTGKTIEQLELELEEKGIEQQSFIKNPDNGLKGETLVRGEMDLDFNLNSSELNKLKYHFSTTELHVINHNSEPKAGIYAWLLLIFGGLLSLLLVMVLLGLFLSLGKEE